MQRKLPRTYKPYVQVNLDVMRQALLAQGMTYADLGRLINRTRSAVSLFMNGHSRNPQLVAQIGKALDIPATEWYITTPGREDLAAALISEAISDEQTETETVDEDLSAAS